MTEKITQDYLDSLDKRTSKYKEAKVQFDIQLQENGPEGLGDVIETITEATGIKKIVEWIAGDDCGCNERKIKLNKLFPIRRNKPKCLLEDEYTWLYAWYETEKFTMRHRDQVRFLEIYNRVFTTKYSVTSCDDCMVTKINELKRVYDTYKAN